MKQIFGTHVTFTRVIGYHSFYFFLVDKDQTWDCKGYSVCGFIRESVNSSQAGTPSSPNDSSPKSSSMHPRGADGPGQLTNEEWNKINQL